jgi:hypothetical protein
MEKFELEKESNQKENVAQDVETEVVDWVLEIIRLKEPRYGPLIKNYLKDNHTDHLLPPWNEHAQIPHGSISWRMGYGEEYLSMFWLFYAKLSESKRRAYQEKHPEPEDWRGFYLA